MSYYELAQSLSELDFDDVKSGVKSLWGFAKDPIGSVVGALMYVKEQTQLLYDKLLALTGYEKSKGSSYIGTNLSLSTIDPTGKLLTAAGGGLFGKIGNRVNDIIVGGLKYNQKILSQMLSRGWSKVNI